MTPYNYDPRTLDDVLQAPRNAPVSGSMKCSADATLDIWRQVHEGYYATSNIVGIYFVHGELTVHILAGYRVGDATISRPAALTTPLTEVVSWIRGVMLFRGLLKKEVGDDA